MVTVIHKKAEICDHCGVVFNDDNPKYRVLLKLDSVKKSNALCDRCNNMFWDMYMDYMNNGITEYHRKLVRIERMIKQKD